MKKICIDIPETKEEAIALMVKAAVSSEDIDTWLVKSKKAIIISKLERLQTIVSESDRQINFISRSEFNDIAKQVEKQVIDLIVGFEQ